MPIVALTGYKTSGKNTAADFLGNHLWPSTQLAFADSLRDEVAAILKTTTKWLNENKTHPLIRNALQFWGQHQKEICGNKVWIETILNKLEAIPIQHYVFVTDLRFPFEAEALKKNRPTVIIKVERHGLVNNDPHPSEIEIDKIHQDFFLRNNGIYLRAFKTECKWLADHIKHFFKNYNELPNDNGLRT